MDYRVQNHLVTKYIKQVKKTSPSSHSGQGQWCLPEGGTKGCPFNFTRGREYFGINKRE